MKRSLIYTTVFSAMLGLTGCGGGEDSSSSSINNGENNTKIPNSGSSITGIPSSLIGKTLVQTVSKNDGSRNIIGVGGHVVYSFIDNNTILGEGLHTVPTTGWTYKREGNKAIVELKYDIGWARDELTFTSATAGTYRSETGLISGTKGWHEGTFVINEGTLLDDPEAGDPLGSSNRVLCPTSFAFTDPAHGTSQCVDVDKENDINYLFGNFTSFTGNAATYGDSALGVKADKTAKSCSVTRSNNILTVSIPSLSLSATVTAEKYEVNTLANRESQGLHFITRQQATSGYMGYYLQPNGKIVQAAFIQLKGGKTYSCSIE